jgi:hypothetical protein
VQASVQASSVANSDWRFGSVRTHQFGVVLQLECSSERICRILGLWWEREIESQKWISSRIMLCVC